jgi:hypothetical protein
VGLCSGKLGRMTGYDDLADRLDEIAEELADLALDRLRAAVGDEGTSDAAVAEERRVSKARRRIVEAAELLRQRQ